MSGRRLRIIAVALLLFWAPTAGADWGGIGEMLGSTGELLVSGPMTSDIAFRTTIPGVPWQEIVVQGNLALIATETTTGPNGSGSGLWELNLETGEIRQRFSFQNGDGNPLLLSNSLIIHRDCQIQALDLETGRSVWAVDPRPEIACDTHPQVPENELLSPDVARSRTEKIVAAVRAENVTYVAHRWQTEVGIMGIADDGTTTMDWQRNLDSRRSQDDSESGESPDRAASYYPAEVRLTADAHRLFAAIIVLDAPTPIYGATAQGLSLEYWGFALAGPAAGESLWKRHFAPTLDTTSDSPQPRHVIIGPPSAKGALLGIRLDEFNSVNAETGANWDTTEAGGQDFRKTLGAATGWYGNELLFTTGQTIGRWQPDGSASKPLTRTTAALDFFYGVYPIFTTSNRAFAQTYHELEPGKFAVGLEAFNADTLEVNWTWHGRATDGGWAGGIAFDDGLAIMSENDGNITVFGRAGAGPRFPIMPASQWLETGVQFTVNLTGDAGPFGRNVRFQADWGDGQSSGWTASPVFSHTYAAGDHVATFRIENEGGFTATQSMSLLVSAAPAAEPEPVPQQTVLQQLVSPANYDLTFGLLGILLAVAGAALGVWSTRRRRTRLRRALSALEQDFNTLQPGESPEAFLQSRRTRFKMLHGRARLTDGQLHLLERRIDELLRNRRLSVIENEFGFLPYVLVRKLRAILEDGVVTPLEKTAAMAAVETYPGLSKAQRVQVVKRLQDWSTDSEPVPPRAPAVRSAI